MLPGAVVQRGYPGRVTLSARDLAYLEHQHSAAMITLGADGMPHAVRIGVALVDGKLWSSGTQSRLRTRHVRRDPRASLFVFDQQYGYLGIDAHVTILEGPDVPDLSVRLFQVMQSGMPHLERGTLLWNAKEISIDEFRQTMIDEQRVIYEFEPLRAYGMHADAPG
jgi:PPOX class probable F420-dependent enzyme